MEVVFFSFSISDEWERMRMLYTGAGIPLENDLGININCISEHTRLKDTPNIINP